MQTLFLVLATIGAALAVLATVFVVGMRRKSPAVLGAVRRVGRATKPLVLRRAGQAASPTAVVEHVGRRTGRRFETPIVVTPIAGGFAIALPYGADTDWLKNVLAAGRATLRVGGASVDVEAPEVVGIDDVNEHFPVKDQRLHRRFRVGNALVVRTRGRAPLRSLG